MTESIIDKKENKIKKLWTDIPASQCILSSLNTRQTIPKDAVERLAGRIKRYGFETTRALWAVKNNDIYEVFAGGLRLEGAKKAKSDVAVLEFIGYSDDEIVALSDKDNEDDEYHTKVSPVEVWASYARLRKMDWTQDRIATAKGVARPTVTWRLKLYDEMSDKVKKNVRQGLIDEGHLHEILDLFVNEHLSTWLTTEEARKEMINKTMIHMRKNGSKSTKAVRADVNAIKIFIDKVDTLYMSFKEPEILYKFVEADEAPEEVEYDARKDFLKSLKENSVRTQTDAAFYCKEIKGKISESLQAYKEYVEGESEAADEETNKQKELAEIRNKFLNEDGLKELKNLGDGSIRLVLVDPPYGMSYQSNRRWKSEKREKIKGDTVEESLSLVDNLLKTVKTKLMDDAHLLIFTNSSQLCNIRNLFIKNEYNLKGEIIWVKEEHGAGDLKGTFAPQHEYIVHGSKGKPEVSPRKPTVFQVARENGANPKGHPTEKPVMLLKELIEATTSKGELVIDPFAGSASTLVAALELERDYWGCEIDKEYWEEGISRLEEQMDKS